VPPDKPPVNCHRGNPRVDGLGLALSWRCGRLSIRNLRPNPYLRLMRNKPIEPPPEVASAFVRDMRAYFAEKSPLKRDEIASRQIRVLRQFQG
jgi:hypothetical protein